MASKCVKFLLSLLRAVPVIFVTTIVVWSYYAYTIQLCLFNVENLAEKILYLIFYHLILFFFSWSFWVTVFTPVAVPPFEYNLSSSDVVTRELLGSTAERKKIINNFGKSLGVQCRLVTGDVRFCEKCNAIKPDRAHHCSVCGKCILKLDHHCPWVNNCVCFSNYKFFLLFLVYGLLYCLYIFSTSFKYFIIFWEGVASTISSNMGNLHVVFLFFISAMFFISIAVLLSYHVYLVVLNRSTIESYQTPMFANGLKDEHAFNLGYKANFYEIFGKNPKLWFLPVFSSFGDGLKYPMRHPPISSNYNTMESVMNVPNIAIDIYDSCEANKLADNQSISIDDKHMLLNDSMHPTNDRDLSIVSDYTGF